MFRGSGYDFAINIGSYANLAFLIPALSVVIIILGLAGKEKLHKEMALLTGVLPSFGLLYVVIKTGTEVFQVLAIGAYLTVLTGMVMAFISRQSNTWKVSVT